MLVSTRNTRLVLNQTFKNMYVTSLYVPSYNTMPDEQVIQEGGGSFVGAVFSNLILSMLTLGLYAYLVASNSGVMVTDQRIIIKQGGMFGSATSEIRLDNVQGVATNGRVFEVSNAAGEQFSLKTGSSGELRTAINKAQQ